MGFIEGDTAKSVRLVANTGSFDSRHYDATAKAAPITDAREAPLGPAQ
ncbi:hypothetical protein [Clostridium sp.]|nr:hypothetical protein [Clostridium sp.]MDU3396017.1 hypothetical protein [Clostridiales bacterium]